MAPLVVLLVLAAPGVASAACVSTPTTVTYDDPTDDAEPKAPEITGLVVSVDAACTITAEPGISNRPHGLHGAYPEDNMDSVSISFFFAGNTVTREVMVTYSGANWYADGKVGAAATKVGAFGTRLTFDQIGVSPPVELGVGVQAMNIPLPGLWPPAFDYLAAHAKLPLLGPTSPAPTPAPTAPAAPAPAPSALTTRPAGGGGKPALALRRRSVVVRSRGKAPVTVTCGRGAGRCEGVATLTARSRLLGEAVVDVPEGASRTVSIRLSASARRLLARHRRLVAKLRIELDTPEGTSVVRSFALTLRRG